MKAKLEYNLPEDQSLFDAACKATDLRSAVSDFDNALRDWIKHGHNFLPEDKHWQCYSDESSSV